MWYLKKIVLFFNIRNSFSYIKTLFSCVRNLFLLYQKLLKIYRFLSTLACHRLVSFIVWSFGCRCRVLLLFMEGTIMRWVIERDDVCSYRYLHEPPSTISEQCKPNVIILWSACSSYALQTDTFVYEQAHEKTSLMAFYLQRYYKHAQL